ncbi:MAG: prolyl oligopeptidase family serine peptidase [Polaribacter sp.]|nr:prolyl oligopeptidase family serine peptidase [Polaribacter sp.]MDG1812017.1 prolyl oligopeptidase family serine peptidase [Polaribacter sp.]MDG1994552.1 prolyl oligopeptidase family serine peptidase [Polaribacter sp.]
MKTTFYSLLFLLTISVSAQKKVLDHPDFDIWNTIKNQTISNNGKLIMYSLEKGEKDRFLRIKDEKGNALLNYDRVAGGQFTYDSKNAIFTIKQWKDSITEMTRRKVNTSKMAKDTLAIYNISKKSLTKIANVKSYKVPQKWSEYVAYQLHEIKAPKKKTSETTTTKNNDKPKKLKKVSAKNGFHLVLRNLATQKEDTIKYVKSYAFAKEGKKLMYVTTGKTGSKEGNIVLLNLDNNKQTTVFSSGLKTKYYQLTLNDAGNTLGFVVDADTTKALVRPHQLYVWKRSGKATEIKANNAVSKGYKVSSNGNISFSKDNSKMYFGLATQPIVKDTTLLKDEIVNVEVWAYDSPRLYTVQEIQEGRDKRKSYTAALHLNSNKIVQLATTEYPTASFGNEGNSENVLISNPTPYMLESQWTGMRASDYAIINSSTGAVKNILEELAGGASLSPQGKFAYGYNTVDSTWFAYDIAKNRNIDFTKGKVFYNELNDTPNHPRSYGLAGWTKDDKEILIYDRYDIFKFNPSTGQSTKLTNGRASKTVYRYARLDREERFINDSGTWLLTTFNETTKNSGYYEFNAKRNRGKQLLDGPFRYSNPIKAVDSKNVLFTRQSFIEFPNLRLSDLSFKKQTVLSDANPQQKDYNWGTIELHEFTSLEGKALKGLLVKPENFDPTKKYPMLVNFYERSSDGLHNHRAPSPGRSSINYSFYTSRGYVIFNPDIVYRDGYPGESAYNAVIPGITSLINKGFINKDKIGAQGHSWGGYQVAHLATKTDIFAAIESGAPVVNMISAYGGIRWDSGLSRQFQYEHTQSRIGGTPWEFPMRYIENSPIYNMDKVNTPILIMHNDKDGHVPWYQGIEYFTALRRLGKPTWLLNYNGARHWPLKMQNRKDFNIRMAQFFDHYLKDEAKPSWMHRGVPAIEKGIKQGYELMKNE